MIRAQSRCTTSLALIFLTPTAVLARGPAPDNEQAVPARRYDFDIAAQPLEAALVRFSQITGISVLNDSATVSGKRGARTVGGLTASTAIVALLSGTGLRARFTAGGSIVILPARKADVVLDRIEARGRPPIGRAAVDPRWTSYGDLVQAKVRSRLGEDPDLSRGRYAIVLRLWLTRSGQVTRPDLVRGSGDLLRDQRFVNTISALEVGTPPPADMPQPLTIEFTVR
jgi:hypothetical protein